MEDLLEYSWNHSSLRLLKKISLHSVSFSRSSLSVGHQSPVPALEQVLNKRLSNLLVDFFLSNFLVENVIKIERKLLLLRKRLCLLLVFALNLFVLVYHKTRRVVFSIKNLVLIQGPESADHLYVFSVAHYL